MISTGFKRQIIIFLGIILAIMMGWLGTRWWSYQREAPLRAGIGALKDGNYRLAIEKIKPYAESGNSLAERTIGDMYAFGLGLPYDEVQAVIWFRRAESKNKVMGQAEYDVALDYINGRGVQKDTIKAAKWLQRAAEAGNTSAQRMIADQRMLSEKGLKVNMGISEYWRNILEKRP
jgi:TPR repeat protein